MTRQSKMILRKKELYQELLRRYYKHYTGEESPSIMSHMNKDPKQIRICGIRYSLRLLRGGLDINESEAFIKEYDAIPDEARLDIGLEDVNMPSTKIESVRNKVAELMAQGLNANEIGIYLKKLKSNELIRVIMDLIEHPVEVE